VEAHLLEHLSSDSIDVSKTKPVMCKCGSEADDREATKKLETCLSKNQHEAKQLKQQEESDIPFKALPQDGCFRNEKELVKTHLNIIVGQ